MLLNIPFTFYYVNIFFLGRKRGDYCRIAYNLPSSVAWKPLKIVERLLLSHMNPKSKFPVLKSQVIFLLMHLRVVFFIKLSSPFTHSRKISNQRESWPVQHCTSHSLRPFIHFNPNVLLRSQRSHLFC